MAFDPKAFIAENEIPDGESPSFDPKSFIAANEPLNPNPSIGQLEEQLGLLGGTGQPMSREEAINLSRQRFVDRAQLEGQPNIQLLDGKVVDVNQLSTLGKALLSIPRAFSSGQTFGLTDTAEKGLENALLATGLTTPEAVQALGVGAQKRQQSEADILANFVGGVATGAPTASAIGRSPGILRKVISGGSTGAQGGALSELNEQISTGQEIDPSKIATSAAIGGTIGAAIPTGAQVLASGGKAAVNTAKTAYRRLDPLEATDVKFSDLAVDTFRPSTRATKENLQAQIGSGEIQDNIRAISKFGPLKGTVSGLENGRKAVDELSTRITEFDTANADVINNTDDVAEQIRSIASSRELMPKAVKEAINEFAETISGDRSLKKSRDLLNELNDRRRAYYKKASEGKETDLDNALHEAEQLARDSISNKLDNIYRATTGMTDNPYRQYGSLNGFLDALSVRVDDLITKRGIEKSVGPTLDREVLSTLKKNKSLLTGGELGRIDDRFNRMVSMVEDQPTRTRPLTQEEIDALPPVQREMPNSPEANRLTLEQQFRELSERAQRQRAADLLKSQEYGQQSALEQAIINNAEAQQKIDLQEALARQLGIKDF